MLEWSELCLLSIEGTLTHELGLCECGSVVMAQEELEKVLFNQNNSEES